MGENSKIFLDVIQLFQSCRDNSQKDVIIEKYINGYERLCTIFSIFGRLFSFVTKDVSEKISILRQHLASEAGLFYTSVVSMTDYETDKNLAAVKQGKLLSGSRTLLRLHRALLFLIEFFRRLKSEANTEKLGKLTWEAYNETLAQHHIWVVRKAVGFAVYTLPTRAELLAKMDGYSEQQALLEIETLTVELQQVYNIVETIYVEHNFTHLP